MACQGVPDCPSVGHGWDFTTIDVRFCMFNRFYTGRQCGFHAKCSLSDDWKSTTGKTLAHYLIHSLLLSEITRQLELLLRAIPECLLLLLLLSVRGCSAVGQRCGQSNPLTHTHARTSMASRSGHVMTACTPLEEVASDASL